MYLPTIIKFALFTSAVLPTVLGAPVPKEPSSTSNLERRPEGHLETHDGHLAELAPRPGSFATRAFVDIYVRDPVDKHNIKIGEKVMDPGLKKVDKMHHDAIIDYHKEVVKQHMEEKADRKAMGQQETRARMQTKGKQCLDDALQRVESDHPAACP